VAIYHNALRHILDVNYLNGSHELCMFAFEILIFIPYSLVT